MMLIALVVFIAAMIQGMMGFGMALFAMPVLVALLGIQVASPAFALLGITATFLNALRWRRDVTWQDVTILLLPALIGVPIGVLFLNQGDPVVVTRVLGVVLVAYALYALFGRALPAISNRAWAYVAGLLAGALTGAYNAGGPPVVMYASARQWSPDRFKGNMAVFFFIMGVAVCISHAVSGHFTAEVWRIALLSLPALYLGQLAGVYAGKRVSPLRFRQLVLVLLVVLGVQLLI